MKKTLHPKIQALRHSAGPIQFSDWSVDAQGKLVDLKVRADEGSDDSRIIKGYLCVWNVVDRHRTIWIRGCFAKSIRERGPASGAKQKIIMLWQHRTDEPIGQFRKLEEDEYGLYFEAELDPIPTADRALIQVRSGTINQFSFGFDYVWDKMEWDDQLEAVRVFEAELFEGSPVSFASIKDTHAIRSAEQYGAAKEQLIEDTDFFIKSIPRSQQLELRNLIQRHVTLAKLEPGEGDQNPLKKRSKPDPMILDIGELLKSFN